LAVNGPESLDFLLGRWEGEGEGTYPTIRPFSYREESIFLPSGKGFLAYSQRTWALDDGRPLHSETGYLRPGPGGRVELVLAHPTGVVEVEEGAQEGQVLELASTFIGLTATAKTVSALSRSIKVEGDIMAYTLAMAAVGRPLQEHLRARLRRTSALV
jgi:hypothetical protein